MFLLDLTGRFVIPNLAEFRDTAPLSQLLSQATGDDRYMKYLEKGALSLV